MGGPIGTQIRRRVFKKRRIDHLTLAQIARDLILDHKTVALIVHSNDVAPRKTIRATRVDAQIQPWDIPVIMQLLHDFPQMTDEEFVNQVNHHLGRVDITKNGLRYAFEVSKNTHKAESKT